MPFEYPPESQKMGMIGHLEEMRRRILTVLVFFAAFAALSFAFGSNLLELARFPMRGVISQWVFLAPAEAFSAYCKIVLLSAFILTFPVLIHQAWAFLSPAFPPSARSRALLWLLSAVFLFLAGILFAYFILIPAALDFLLGFGKKLAVPLISLEQYLSFFVVLILAGGLLFEIPLVMSFLADLRFLKAEFCRSKRPMVLVVLLAVAAVVTPTQDIFNMLLMAVPMYLLYESGILLISWIERKQRKGE